MSVKEKVILITGANGGLGSAVTRAFLDAGAKVAGVSRAITAGEFAHPSFVAYAADITTRAAADALAAEIQSKWGRVDALVHLVGGFAAAPLLDSDDQTLEKMLRLNVWPFLHMVQAVLSGMRARRSGAVLAIGSKAAIDPQPGIGAYSASKAALVSLVQTVAKENREFGISANVILPGTMDTPGNRASMPDADFRQWVRPEQVAALLVHLATDQASQISGAVIPVYGGDL